jgi:hypothetical protein
VLAYDYTVLAGTQGNAQPPQDRSPAGWLAHQLKLPVVLFAEGGGGRPGDTDMPIVAGLNNHTFSQFAALSGKVPVVGIVHGRCFAGNAALLGCADVIIATKGSNIGNERPRDDRRRWPGHLRARADRAEQRAVAQWRDRHPGGRRGRGRLQPRSSTLSYFQGATTDWQFADQRTLRHVVPREPPARVRRARRDARRGRHRLAA